MRDRRHHPTRFGLAAHVGRENRAGADRLGENKRIAGLEACLAQRRRARHKTIDGKSERQLRALAGMAADERATGLPQHFIGAEQHRREIRLDLGFQTIGDRGDRKRRLRFAAHGVDVAQRVVGGNFAEQVRIVDDGAEIVDGLDRQFGAAGIDEGGVIRRIETDDDIGARGRLDPAERARQHARSHLRAAAAAAHGRWRRFP